MANRRYGGYGYGYGPQAQPGYNPYSKKPDYGSAIREILQNLAMQKQMKEQRGERKLEREQREKEFGLRRLRANLELEEVASRRRADELAPRIEAQKKTEREGWISQLPKEVQAYARLEMTPPRELYKREYGTEEVDLIEKERKTLEDKKYTQRKGLMKNLKSRLGKEVTTLKQMSKSTKTSMGVLEDNPTIESIEAERKRKKASSHLINVESALDFLGRMESSLESGTFGKRQAKALVMMMGNIAGLREGTLLDKLRASWVQEGRLTPQAPTRKQWRNKKTGQLDWFVLKGGKWVKE